MLNWNRWSLVALAFAGAAIATPWLLAHSPGIGLALLRGFELVCHQQADRSFFLFGGAVAVCARCLGIYFGAAAGALVRVARQFAMRLFFIAAAINLIDWLTEFSGLHGNWMFTRFALGILLGMAGAMLVASVDTGEVHARVKPA